MREGGSGQTDSSDCSACLRSRSGTEQLSKALKVRNALTSSLEAIVVPVENAAVKLNKS
jgi:hypothetical protein